MNTSKLAKLGLVGLAYGSIMVMTATDAPRAQASREAKDAAKQAERAAKALRQHDFDAVTAAEAAVALQPGVPAYRMLLGQSYLQAGRFASARDAFADTLALDSSNGRAALNLALAQVATGDWQAAQRTLNAHAAEIPASDRGLALALAGDTAGGVALLTQVARSGEASPKVRQNLALSFALGGQWQAARVVAAADMSPADVDARLKQWAAFAQPVAASDQVASLLGVRAVADAGQPVALALNAPVRAGAPVQMAEAGHAPVMAPVADSVARVQQVTFGPHQEVVQPITAPLIARVAGPAKTQIQLASGRKAAPRLARVTAPKPTGGQWFVQLGAYDNAGVAKDAWGRARRRFAGFSARTPNGVAFKAGAATYYRLSVGGFARADADRACRAYKARGGDCFVRVGAGDQMARWSAPRPVQVAMR